MRIATFNLESLDPVSRAGVPLSARAQILRPQLQRLRADVIALQEVNGQRRPGEHIRSLAALDELLADTPYSHFHRASTAGPGGAGVADVHNLVVLSRFPILRQQEIRHQLLAPLAYQAVTAIPAQTAPEPVTFDRSLLAVELDTGDGRPLHLLNVHLRAPLASPIAGQKEAPFVWRSVKGWAEGYFVSALKRAGQALELRLAIDAVFDAEPQARIVVLGDFNAEDRDPPLEIVIGAEEDTGNGLLAGRSLVLLDRSLPQDRRYSVQHHGRPQMLDHVLASRALAATFVHLEAHNETLDDELVSYTRLQHSTASYHAPVVAEFAAGRAT